jgi:hypothetical protein
MGIDSFALQNDGANASSTSEPFLSRQVSAANSTRSGPVDGEAPYAGPSGPSFPYQMYQQNVRMRNMMDGSTPAASSAPAHDPSYQGPRGPAYPYGLYPQNTVGLPGPLPVVGFPGMGDAYQRQIGPDGEEAQLVGPLGHTEELPPYSRYPEETYTAKPSDSQPDANVAAVAASAAAPASPAGPSTATEVAPASPVAMAPIPGAGGIGLAPRNPEFDGPEDTDSPSSRHSSRSFTAASDLSHHEINTAARAVTEKQKPVRKWQAFGRRRLWGIVPYWAICLLISGFLIMGVILGSVIGSFVAKQHKKPRREGDP